MALPATADSPMSGNRTEHQAKSVGDGRWVVSFLPGRTLTTDQASAAIQAAEAVALLGDLADKIGLTTQETVWLALQESSWGEAAQRQRTLRRR